MKLEEMLQKYHTVPKEIVRLSQTLRTAIEAATNNDGCIRASLISDMPKGTRTSDPTYEHTADLIEQLEEIGIELANLARDTKHQMLELLHIKNEIDIAYYTLDADEQTIIRMRYMDMPDATWKRIAEVVHYSEKQAIRIHNQALAKMRQIVDIKKGPVAI